MTSQKNNSCIKWQKVHKTKNNFKSISSFLNKGVKGEKTGKGIQAPQLKTTPNCLMMAQSVKGNRCKQ